MRQVQRALGQGYSRTSGNDGVEFWEVRLYPPGTGDAGHTVTFRWGVNLDGCHWSQGPASALIPSRDIDR